VVKRLARMDSVAQFDLPYGLDMWDGYAAERQRLYSVFTQAKAHPIVLAGDSHAFWANELYDAPEGGVRVAAEFGATAITSPGAGDVLTGIPVGEAFAKANREVLYNNSADKGFVLLTLRRDEAVGQMVAVSTIAQPTFETKVLKAYRLTPQAGGGVSPLTEV
jgi:alkaline phosphatase D